ncbi:ABC transporter permease [Furfurilactobacillus siliginis]|uniref:ABC transporter permease n=1 Tax=Furfurilactobacillus siliginis TaxID=348151 RepID=A0A0R2LBN0_9LACO|nr:hypothetical protein [Furfurilactobacillus siliginis]KRN96474.1 ABC transporter, permease protein [Furfurilactobacillus siliginis]GEK29429.1 ABC transporter permease [Furfurilactobacillus siliginis]
MFNQAAFQTGRLLRINLRRDWRKLLVWLLVMTGLFAAIAGKFNSLYGTKADIAQITATLKNPAMIAMFGRLPSAPLNTADVFASEMTVFMAIFGAIMNFTFAIPLTRGDEESGVTELVSAHAVGILAPLNAAISELFLLNAGLTGLYLGGLQLSGLTGATFAGNLVLSCGLGLNGFLFALVAIVCAQISGSSRGAMSMAYGVFGLAYLWRMVTDVTHPSLTWWSPLGWVEKFSSYRDNNWLPALLMLISIVILLTATLLLREHRDFNSGLIAPRPGRKRAVWWLKGPAGLFWRLDRTTILVWLIAVAILGASYGSVFDSVAGILKHNPLYAGLLGDPHAMHAATTQIIKSFMALLTIVFAVLAAIPGLQLINRIISDENRGYLELLHAGPTPRWRLFGTLIIGGSLTSLLTLGAGIAGLGGAANAVLKQPLPSANFINIFIANSTAVLLILSFAAILAGWLPRFTNLIWGYLGLIFFVGYLGGLLNLPKWTDKLSPFGYLGRVPVHTLNWSVFWWQLALVAVCFAIALVGYQRRDIAAKN